MDYSKAYDSVIHPMLRALFYYLQISPAWIHVLTKILQGPVLFLVGGDVVRDEELRPAFGIPQGDPLFPILFSLVMSMLRPHDATFWLYSDDALLRFSCPDPCGVEGVLLPVRASFEVSTRDCSLIFRKRKSSFRVWDPGLLKWVVCTWFLVSSIWGRSLGMSLPTRPMSEPLVWWRLAAPCFLACLCPYVKKSS